MANLLNFLLYQIGWFACVLGLSWEYQWAGSGIALSLVAIHLWLARDRAVQIRLMLFASVLGIVVDTAQLWAGVFRYPTGQILTWLPPPGMLVLWLQFATIFRYCLGWLSGRYLLSGVFGLFGAPLAFLAGESFGAIEFLPPRWLHLAVLAAIWSATVPLLVLVGDLLADRNSQQPGYLWLGREMNQR